MWILISLIVICGFFLLWFVWKNSFTNQFLSQGSPANKLKEKEIENWKNRGLNGAEAGQAYNNGWIDPENPRILEGKITYTNYQQTDENINPARINRNQLDSFYKLLTDISQDNNSNFNYIDQINCLNYNQLPSWRQREDLLRVYNEKKYDNIYQELQQLQTIEEVKKESSNINTLENYYLPNNKKKMRTF